MHFHELPVDPSLAPYIESLWTLSSDGETAPSTAGLVTPDGCVELVFALGQTSVGLPQPMMDHFTPTRARTNAFVLGMTTRPWQVDYGGAVRLFGIRLRPAAAVALFSSDLATIRDSARPISDLLPRLVGNSWAEPSSETPQFYTNVSRAVAAAIAGRRNQGDDRVGRAMTAIQFANGRVCLAHLARDVGMSTRHLDRCFDRFLGICPKMFCRIARFRAAWEMGLTSRREGWAMIADRCGYADQAHLCREFREFSGQTPGQTAALG